MSCKICGIIPASDSYFRDVAVYADIARVLDEMVKDGKLETTYMTCPFDRIFSDKNGNIAFYAPKMLHQVRCKECGKIYGLFCDVEVGVGQIKENDKVFNPDDYNKKD